MDDFANYLGLNHYSSTFPCPWCDANSLKEEDDEECAMLNARPAPWNDWSPGARWVALPLYTWLIA